MSPSLKKKWPFSKNENERAPLSATWAAGALRCLGPPYFCPMLCGNPVAVGPVILSCRKRKVWQEEEGWTCSTLTQVVE